MSTPAARFALPETRAAQQRWCEITGHDTTSAEWGEVCQVLKDAGLTEPVEQHLFDAPGHSPQALQVRDLCLAVTLGALLHRRHPEHDPATATAIVAALLAHHYSDHRSTWSHEEMLPELERDLPPRVLYLTDSPAEALGRHYRAELDGLPPDIAERFRDMPLLMEEAGGDDNFAKRVFARLATARGVALASLSYGGWLVYHCG